jgi:hypothetical protein
MTDATPKFSLSKIDNGNSPGTPRTFQPQPFSYWTRRPLIGKVLPDAVFGAIRCDPGVPKAEAVLQNHDFNGGLDLIMSIFPHPLKFCVEIQMPFSIQATHI